MNFLNNRFFNINKEGYIFIFMFVVASAVFGLVWPFLGWILTILTLWCIYFFRDPERVVPYGTEVVVSPADGVVQKIEDVETPAELDMGNELRTRISIFLSVFDVHVNRVPAIGKITKLHYHHGKFFNASLDKASIHNERQIVAMELEDGRNIIFSQIAGLIARRIVCDLHEGQKVVAGERFGIIRFGSRMDVYLPKGVKPKVLEGQRMIAGETVLAELS